MVKIEVKKAKIPKIKMEKMRMKKKVELMMMKEKAD